MEIRDVKQPLLELDTYFFSEIHIVANAALTPEELRSGMDFGCSFAYDVELGTAREDDRKYQVVLTATNQGKEGLLQAYDIRVRIVGFFTVSPEYPEERKKGMVAVLGPSLLCGALREFILATTSRGPYPPVCLPATTFIPEETPE